MKLSRMKAALMFLLAVLLSAPLFADTRGANTALPGTLNYVEGQASMGSETLSSKSIGSAELQTGESLNTGNGRAEVLLTPGVFLRLDSDSSAKMISPTLTNTRVEINKGRALVEVAEIYKANDIQVLQNGKTTLLLKPGLYEFDADQNQVRVFDGQAVVRDGDRELKLKGGREVSLNGNDRFKAQKFDKKAYESSDLYRFSSLRSSYLAEANVDAAHIYASGYGYGPGWYGSGWYWDPWFSAYTFIPGNGIFYSPFGYGFYSPLWAYRAPYFWGGHYYRGFGPEYRNPAIRGGVGFRGTPGHMGPVSEPGFRGGAVGGGFHAGGLGGSGRR